MTASPTPAADSSAAPSRLYADDYPGVLLHWQYTSKKATRVVVAFDGPLATPTATSRPAWAVQHRVFVNKWATQHYARSRRELETILPGKVAMIREHLPERPAADQYPARTHKVAGWGRTERVLRDAAA